LSDDHDERIILSVAQSIRIVHEDQGTEAYALIKLGWPTGNTALGTWVNLEPGERGAIQNKYNIVFDGGMPGIESLLRNRLPSAVDH
jgi:hypothetical protein